MSHYCDHRARKSGLVSSEDWPHYKIRGCDALYFVSFTFARYLENLRFRTDINVFYFFVIKVPVLYLLNAATRPSCVARDERYKLSTRSSNVA